MKRKSSILAVSRMSRYELPKWMLLLFNQSSRLFFLMRVLIFALGSAFVMTISLFLRYYADNVTFETQVAQYNQLVKFQLPTFGCKDSLGVIVGSTKVFWPHFITWLTSLPAVPKDPIDNFYRHTVESVVANINIPGLSYEIRYDWDRPATGRFVHVQTAGHLAGAKFHLH